MTFGNLRKNLNQISEKGKFELLRFCNKLNTTVIGGANKLFKYFILKNEYNSIISYCNMSKYTGSVYNKLGMKYISKSYPNYFYLDSNAKRRLYRWNFRKDILVKEGFDKNKSEKQIMSERGYYRIYDCGNFKFEFTI